MPPETIARLAYAKLNLTLEVLGRRPDGFHEVKTVLQTIDLADRLTFEPHERVELRGNRPELAGPDNLVWQAAQELQTLAGCRQGARITLEKAIPVAAGLGGGSSDAAATLLALNQLWDLGLSRETLEGVAARLGADVAFFLYGGTALAEGRGEKITPLAPFPPTTFLLVHPPIFLEAKTARMYAALGPNDFASGEATGRLVAALRRSEAIAPDLFFNTFDRVGERVFPQIRPWRRHLWATLRVMPHLCGSGPSFFVPLAGEAGREWVGQLQALGLEAWVAHSVEAS